MNENNKRRYWNIKFNVFYKNQPTREETISIYHVGEMYKTDARKIVKDFLENSPHSRFTISSINPTK